MNPINEHTHWNNFWNSRKHTATWNVQHPDIHLVEFLKTHNSTDSLELGCGTGVNARYISAFSNIDAIDISEFAITEAKSQSTTVNYILDDFATVDINKKYDFIFDRGYYHGYLGCNLCDRLNIVEKISKLLTPNGYWLSIIGSDQNVTDDNVGPPQHSYDSVVNSINSYMRVESIKLSYIENQNRLPSPAWVVISTTKNYD